jgi:hypothetical protein
VPYTLKGNCVVRADTGETVKCHPTREKAKRHLIALKMNVEHSGEAVQKLLVKLVRT